MDEYRVDVKVRNNLLLSAIEKGGYKTVAEFCRACGIEQSIVGEYLNLKLAPLRRDGEFRDSAQRLIDFFGALPEDLWTAEQLTMEVATNTNYFTVDQKHLTALLDRTATGVIEQDAPDVALERKELREAVRTFLASSLDQSHLLILLGRAEGKTLAEIGKEMDLSPERIRQIEAKATRKLKLKFDIQQFDGKPTTNGATDGIQPSIN